MDGSHQQQETKGQLKRTEPTETFTETHSRRGDAVTFPASSAPQEQVFTRKFRLLEKEMIMMMTRRLRDVEAEDKNSAEAFGEIKE